jgi:signal transduction histidine kinase
MNMGVWQNAKISVTEGHNFSTDDVINILSKNQELITDFFTVEITTPDGITKYLKLSNSAGQNNTLISAGAEITDQVLAQKVLKEMSDKLEKSLESEKELNELKTRFISMVSHEFRTPLTVILNSSAVVDQAIENSRADIASQYLDKINKSVKTMNELMEDVLVIGKSQSTKIEEVTEMDFVRFVKTSLEDIQEAYSFSCSAVLDIKNECKPFYSNESALKHIVHNLITNALKYTINGKDVNILIDKVDDNLEFIVTDHGIGIPEDDLKRLFTNFFRASNVGKIAGTGLGLHIVKQSVDNLYGQITVKSVVNEGTTFEVILPMDIRTKISSKEKY